jgi:imidazolonepropionase-like amidohydrolase
MRALLATLLLLLPSAASAADCAVIVNASVHGPDGLAAGSVVLDGGVIGASDDVGRPDRTKGTIPWGSRTCTFVDGAGKTVTAGLVDAVTSIGLIEVSLEGGSHNIDAGGDPVRAAHQVVDSYNPRSTVIPVTRIEGTTTALVHPRGGLLPGKIGAVQLAGGSQAEAVADPFVGLPLNLNARPSRAATLGWLGEIFDDARDRRSFDRTLRNEPDASVRDLAAINSVLQGDEPLIVGADRAADIEALIRFAKAEKVRLVINGGAEAWLLADALAAAKIPVIVHPYVYGAGSFDQIHGRADNPALLAQAGVQVVIASQSGHFARGLRQVAGNAVRGGMDHATALEAITSTPAEVFGLADRGTLKPGHRADVVLWSGDPLEVTTSVERLWIGGRDVPLESRQTELLERYRTLPGTPLAPLSLP